jgi:transglutaminase-like putative cysteine protease
MAGLPPLFVRLAEAGGLLRRLALAMAVLTTAAGQLSQAQIIQEAAEQTGGVRFGPAVATRFRVGATIAAKGGAVQNILIMVAVPLECPEQEVHVIEEDYSPNIEGVEFRTLPAEKNAPPGARQMLITLRELPAHQEAHALITYEVVTKAQLAPLATDKLKAPIKPDRFMKVYLSGSPFINVGHRKIREAVREALAAPKKQPAADAAAPADDATADSQAIVSPGDQPSEEDAGAPAAVAQDHPAEEPASATSDASPVDAGVLTDWQRVEKLYDYVQDHIEYEEGAQDKSSLESLQDGKADCHGIAALFVAMCRTADVPARMVWVDGHQYAEFYLEDAQGDGHWFPVQSAGSRAFGEMPLPKVILQKGDNFRVPERRGERLRYASDYTVLLSSPKHKPRVSYVREQL